MSLLGSVNKNFENCAPGKLYLFPYPTVNPGLTLSAYIKAVLAYLFGADLTYTLPSVSTGATASVTTGGVMTLVTAPTGGALTLGQVASMTGLPPGSVVQSLISGTLNVAASTYQLSIAPPVAITTNPMSSALQPWGDVDENGLQVKFDFDELTFPHNDGSAPSRIISMIKGANGTVDLYDADANHWADIFGSAAGDVVVNTPIVSQSGWTAVALGLPNPSVKWLGIYAMRSAVPGYFDFLILNRINFVTKPDVKYSVKDKIALKTDLVLNGDLYLTTAGGIPVHSIFVTTTSAHL